MNAPKDISQDWKPLTPQQRAEELESTVELMIKGNDRLGDMRKFKVDGRSADQHMRKSADYLQYQKDKCEAANSKIDAWNFDVETAEGKKRDLTARLEAMKRETSASRDPTTPRGRETGVVQRLRKMCITHPRAILAISEDGLVKEAVGQIKADHLALERKVDECGDIVSRVAGDIREEVRKVARDHISVFEEELSAREEKHSNDVEYLLAAERRKADTLAELFEQDFDALKAKVDRIEATDAREHEKLTGEFEALAGLAEKRRLDLKARDDELLTLQYRSEEDLRIARKERDDAVRSLADKTEEYRRKVSELKAGNKAEMDALVEEHRARMQAARKGHEKDVAAGEGEHRKEVAELKHEFEAEKKREMEAVSDAHRQRSKASQDRLMLTLSYGLETLGELGARLFSGGATWVTELQAAEQACSDLGVAQPRVVDVGLLSPPLVLPGARHAMDGAPSPDVFLSLFCAVCATGRPFALAADHLIEGPRSPPWLENCWPLLVRSIVELKKLEVDPQQPALVIVLLLQSLSALHLVAQNWSGVPTDRPDAARLYRSLIADAKAHGGWTESTLIGALGEFVEGLVRGRNPTAWLNPTIQRCFDQGPGHVLTSENSALDKGVVLAVDEANIICLVEAWDASHQRSYMFDKSYVELADWADGALKLHFDANAGVPEHLRTLVLN